MRDVLLFIGIMFYLGLFCFVVRDYDKKLSNANNVIYKLSTRPVKYVVKPIDLNIKRIGNCKITIR